MQDPLREGICYEGYLFVRGDGDFNFRERERREGFEYVAVLLEKGMTDKSLTE